MRKGAMQKKTTRKGFVQKGIEGSISRRNFIASAGLGSMALAVGLAGCSPSTSSVKDDGAQDADTAADEAPSSSAQGFMQAPAPIDESSVSETVSADVVVVGCGVSGLTAARAAVEAGASVAVVEKAESFCCRSGQYAVNNSKFQQDQGMVFDANAAIENLMVCMGYRPDQRLWNVWRDRSGEAFDWFIEPAKGSVEFLPMDATEYGDAKIHILSLHYPAPSGYNPSNEDWPSYPEATLTFVPSQTDIMQLNYDSALSAGVDFHFSTWATQLIRPNNSGRVEGVYARDIDGKIIKFEASKGVVLAAGGYGNDPEMVKYYSGKELPCPMWPNMDAEGNPTNTGDGQKMGIWAGALMEDGPHIQGNHSLGGALGVDAFFMCSKDGKRFMNEDSGGQQLTNRLMRLPGNFCWQVFDDDYPNYVESMGCSHGSVNHVIDASVLPALEGAEMTIGRSALTSREAVDAQCVKADTLEELAVAMGFSDEAAKTFVSQVERYNELCAAGEDVDYGKPARRMAPILTAPFYASKIEPGPMLECMGGLYIDDESFLVLDAEFAPIEGLYAAGNNMGGRFLVDYPTTLAGMSHGTCLTFGYLAGKAAAKA